jgi:hypothetical protein
MRNLSLMAMYCESSITLMQTMRSVALQSLKGFLYDLNFSHRPCSLEPSTKATLPIPILFKLWVINARRTRAELK